MSPEPPAEEGEERCLECGESAGSTSLIARLRAERDAVNAERDSLLEDFHEMEGEANTLRDERDAAFELIRKRLAEDIAEDRAAHFGLAACCCCESIAEARRVLGEVGK